MLILTISQTKNKNEGSEKFKIMDIVIDVQQVEKTYKIISKTIVQYIEPAYQKEISASPFLQFERGEVQKMIKENRGHCSIIFKHYKSGLQEYISKELGQDSEEYLELDNIFWSLSDADIEIFDQMALVADFIESGSEGILELLAQDKLAEAKTRLLKDRKSVFKVCGKFIVPL